MVDEYSIAPMGAAQKGTVMILLKDVTGYSVGEEQFTREEHGGYAYKKAREAQQESGGRIVAHGPDSTYDRDHKVWVRTDELQPAQ